MNCEFNIFKKRINIFFIYFFFRFNIFEKYNILFIIKKIKILSGN